jgi:hypothetical protein
VVPPVVDAPVLIVGALVLVVGELVVGELVVFGDVVAVEVVDLLVELGLELEADWGGALVEVVEWVAGGGLVIVCELVCEPVSAAVECPELVV